jgi:hypothetical protein
LRSPMPPPSYAKAAPDSCVRRRYSFAASMRAGLTGAGAGRGGGGAAVARVFEAAVEAAAGGGGGAVAGWMVVAQAVGLAAACLCLRELVVSGVVVVICVGGVDVGCVSLGGPRGWMTVQVRERRERAADERATKGGMERTALPRAAAVAVGD